MWSPWKTGIKASIENGKKSAIQKSGWEYSRQEQRSCNVKIIWHVLKTKSRPTWPLCSKRGEARDEVSLVKVWIFFIFKISFLKKILFIYFYREGKGRRKRGRETLMWEKHIDWLPLTHRTRDQTCNPGMCPDKESNQWLFGLWDNAQPTEPLQSGHIA